MLKWSKKAIVIFISISMVATLGGCSAKATTKTTDKNSKAPIKITIFGADSNKTYPLGVQTDPVAKEIEKQTGITMDVVDTSTTPEKLQVILASGDLPDIMEVGPNQFKSMIEANQVQELDGLIASNGLDISKNAKEAVAFSKKYFSQGKDKTYFIPGNIDPNGKPTETVAPYIRWDYYKELGYPSIKNYDDLLNMVSTMLNKHPTNENGQKFYGFSPWFDWDLFAYGIFTGYMSGQQYTGTGKLDGMDVFDGTLNSGLDDNSIMFQGVKFWNKAYRMGLLDPDALTQKYDQALQKGSQDRVLCETAAWVQGNTNNDLVKAGQNGKGIEPLPPFEGTEKYNAGGVSSLGNSGRSWCITTACKNPERAMDLINYFFSVDGSTTITNGVKGDSWTTGNNKNVLTDKYKQAVKNDPNNILTTGAGKYGNWAGLGVFYQVNGQPIQISANLDTELEGYLDVDKDYVQHYGVKTKSDVIAKFAKNFMSDSIVNNLSTPTPPDDITRVSEQIGAYAQKSFAQMVLAKDDAQLNDLIGKFKVEVKKMGYDKVWQWYLDDNKKAIAAEKDFKASQKK